MILWRVSENFKGGGEEGLLVRGRKNVRDPRNIVLGALKDIKACLPRNFQRFKMNFDTVFMNTFLFFDFEKVLSSNLKI